LRAHLRPTTPGNSPAASPSTCAMPQSSSQFASSSSRPSLVACSSSCPISPFVFLPVCLKPPRQQARLAVESVHRSAGTRMVSRSSDQMGRASGSPLAVWLPEGALTDEDGKSVSVYVGICLEMSVTDAAIWSSAASSPGI
jgi:hypothetical protein